MTARRRTPTVRTLGVGVTVLALAAVAGCSSGPDDPAPVSTSGAPTASGSTSPSPSASPSPSDSPSDSASPSASASAPAGYSLDEQSSGDWPTLGGRVGIGLESRVAGHGSYDRVVYQFARDGVPSYRVRYVDAPIEDPSGERKDVAGDAWLEVLVSTVDMPGESAPSADDPLPDTLRGTGIAAAPAIWGGFEGVGQSFIGLTGGQRPYKVSVLENPTRLVVDIAR
ncbi:hypothetical protein KMZ32_11940 [Phycicoccus sp. MAQZ13P-2]|uniref:AMIN-like domain-containing (lipo)protein n=1 Tax=Phycicoccus mangrovi TaxID=2840470 RepID=UPI001C006D9A|nr:hypothetical protein [Phycicoccus mangrovi]MBT9256655.1 hypothetical protein [Phycicoccus mangrovi]MBT9274781.1 hypothetical protein [Phycicoccus mangrovi]